METNIIREIKRISLDDSHRFSFITKYIIKNITEIPNLSIQELAKLTYSSPSTISRFTKSLNLSGYKELIHILKYFGYFLIEEQKKEQKKDLGNDVVSNYYYNVISSIQDTFNLLMDQEKIMKEVVDKLRSAKKIFIFAVSVNYNLAKDFQQKLLRIGLNAFAVDDIHNGYLLAKQSNKDIFNIFISYSGETQDLIKLASTCKKNNSPILLLSKKTKNSLSKIVDLQLVISSNESIVRPISIVSRLTLMFSLDVIFYSFLLLDFRHYKDILESTSSTIF